MKFTKASIIVSILVFLIFGVAVANLIMSIQTNTSVVMGAGIAGVMGIVFIATIITAIKEAKKNADSNSEDDSNDDDDDDE